MEISLWKRLRTCRKTDYRMNELIHKMSRGSVIEEILYLPYIRKIKQYFGRRLKCVFLFIYTHLKSLIIQLTPLKLNYEKTITPK
jgi:hypothetical protein